MFIPSIYNRYKLKESRYLIQASIFYDEDGSGIYEVYPTNGGTRLAFKATDEQMIRFLRRTKIKDSTTSPRSYKGLTYQEMLSDIKTGTNSTFWVWSNLYPSSSNIQEMLDE